MKIWIVMNLLVAALTAVSTIPAAHGAEIDGRTYDNVYRAGKVTMELKGTGLLRYWGFKAYTGAFYLEPGVAVGRALTDSAKRLELEYFRPIAGADFGAATDRVMARNVDPETFERLRPRIDTHNALYEDVRPGDRYALTYIPGRGTELALNGDPKGIIPGADFAAAVFAMWLGPEPISRSFKKQIMGQQR